MPHSTSEEPLPAANREDVRLPEVPANDLDVENDGGESSESGDARMLPSDTTKDPAKVDVKLDNLFNDDEDDDEEFPSSGPPSGNIPSSPPAAPMYR